MKVKIKCAALRMIYKCRLFVELVLLISLFNIILVALLKVLCQYYVAILSNCLHSSLKCNEDVTEREIRNALLLHREN